MADDHLSDEQLQQLLKDAEHRLRAARSHPQSKENLSLAALQGSISKISSAKPLASYIKTTEKGAHVDSAHLVSEKERKSSNTIRIVQDPVIVKQEAAEAKKATAGSDWFNLPRTTVTPELKRDLQLLRMRSVLDPKRFYKKENSKAQIPQYSQVGTIVEGPTEYFNARLTNKERKRTFVEEVLESERSSGRFKNKYGQIQAAKTSGKKEFYKKLKARRRGGGVSKG